MLFNWVPQRNVFVSDPLANCILVFDLADDGTLYTARDRELVEHISRSLYIGADRRADRERKQRDAAALRGVKPQAGLPVGIEFGSAAGTRYVTCGTQPVPR